ncbi:response regulator [Ramlibacter terrae]|uniref:Response regulator n=1 Tax=Ramlibacter terrae TaxID=2732511 RepID=A0ABX6P3G1_9BURK|nr:response regulator [Ramlibacter terrae]
MKAYVVEDNPEVRTSLVEALSELGGIESAGSTGNEHAAVAWLRDPANHWDIAVVDLMLEPGGSGFGVLKALRERGATQKMVVLTGAANPETRLRCEALGADGVFDKAMETEAMLDYCVKLARAAGGH